MEAVRGLVTHDEAGMRLDKWLATRFPDASRQAWKGQIEDGRVQVNGGSGTPSRILAAGDRIEALPPQGKESRPLPEEAPIKLLYEDEWFLVVEKPAGLVVHPAHGHTSGTLVNALLGRYGEDLSDQGGQDRPGIVHRLDKDTSGLMLVARDNQTHQLLSALFKRGEIDRRYQALVYGRPEVARGMIDAPIGRGGVNRRKMEVRPDGKEARTEFEVLAFHGDKTHLLCRLHTGRTHQIRVHLAMIGLPVVGDLLYGGRPKAGDPDYQLLHATDLAFRHPISGQDFACHSPLPDRFLPYLSEGDGS